MVNIWFRQRTNLGSHVSKLEFQFSWLVSLGSVVEDLSRVVVLISLHTVCSKYVPNCGISEYSAKGNGNMKLCNNLLVGESARVVNRARTSNLSSDRDEGYLPQFSSRRVDPS